MLRIRLTRVGKKNAPAYRVVVADQRRAVKRKFIEIIGHYNPTLAVKELVINKERATYWLGQGAQATPTVHNLMANLGIVKDKIDIKYSKAPKKTPEEEAASTAETTETPAVAEVAEAPAEEVATEPEVAEEAVAEEVAAEPEATKEAEVEEVVAEPEAKAKE
ncbi:MAG: 30S ribosomal protein S16 [Candidatus Berkelbacteria bacterium]